jgi:hypothetical protein
VVVHFSTRECPKFNGLPTPEDDRSMLSRNVSSNHQFARCHTPDEDITRVSFYTAVEAGSETSLVLKQTITVKKTDLLNQRFRMGQSMRR